MKAAVLSASDAIPDYTDYPDPPPDARNGVLTLVAAALHPVVRSTATGQHYGSGRTWPLIPGVDAVARTREGTLVYTGGTRHPYGTFAELISAPMAIPLPTGADPVLVAAGLNPAMSSWLPLRHRRAELGDASLGTVLVLGATGMAGRLAVQNALALGAEHVIAAGRHSSTLEAVAGSRCSPVALTGRAEQDTAALSAAAAAHHPSTVLDYLWGAPAEATFAALGRTGFTPDDQPVVYLDVGDSAGPDAAVPASLLRSTAVVIRGSGAGTFAMADILAEIPQVMRRMAEGTLTVPVIPYPLAEVAAAWQAQPAHGRVVVTGA